MNNKSQSVANNIASCPIPYPKRFFREFSWSAFRQAKAMLGLKRRVLAPVLSQPLEAIVARHAWVCDVLQDWLPPLHDLYGKRACEAGAGDCLAAASMMLGLGVSRVTIVEGEPPVLGYKQAEVIGALRERGYPCDASILTAEHNLNPDKCEYVQSHMEDYVGAENCSLTYSVCVGEHVEDLTGFFTSCRRVLEPGGLMVHYIDLGGHGMFEDPMPPLDFHLYSDLLYGTIYPRYNRATRRFTSDYIRAAKDAGFQHIQVRPTRKADLEYVEARKPYFKSRAKIIPNDELAVLEFVLSARAF